MSKQEIQPMAVYTRREACEAAGITLPTLAALLRRRYGKRCRGRRITGRMILDAIEWNVAGEKAKVKGESDD